MDWLLTTGILAAAGLFALLLFLNPNLSWTVKRFDQPIRSLLSRKRKKTLKTKDYGLHLNGEPDGGDGE